MTSPSLLQFGYRDALLAPPPPRNRVDWFRPQPWWYGDMLRAIAHLGVCR